MTIHHLRVVNMGVIADAALDLAPGLNVVTGETGAGKTLLLGGVRLLMGGKADSSTVGSASSESRTDGLIVDGDEELAISRIVPAEGRSRAYLDGVIVSVDLLTEKVGGIVEVVGQHDQITLRRPGHVLALVDATGGETLAVAKAEYSRVWQTLQTALADQQSLGGDEMALRRELDLTTYQANEIEGSGLEVGEDTTLEAEANRLRNVGEITGHLGDSLTLLESVADDTGEVIARMRKAGEVDPLIQPFATDAEGISETVGELARSVRHYAENLDTDPERLELVEGRLTAIGELKRKYGQSVEEILSYGAGARARSDEIEKLLGRAEMIGEEVRIATGAVEAAAARLSDERATAAARLETGALSHLVDLGMDDPILQIRLESAEPGPGGADRAELWFASDTRLRPAPIGSGASGGELSRLVLAIRLAARSGATTTLVFDEVDTGVGGATALAMGRKLADLARNHQVLCVTHLPQMAAFADAHFVVSREGATATATKLTDADRLPELSRMLAGLPDSQPGNEAAAELLAMAREDQT